MDVPSTIVHAVAEYRAESDRLAGWFEACVALDPNAYETARAIWENYRQFCAGVPVDPMTEPGSGGNSPSDLGHLCGSRLRGSKRGFGSGCGL